MDKIVAWIKQFIFGIKASVNDQITDSVTQVGPEKKPKPKAPKVKKEKKVK